MTGLGGTGRLADDLYLLAHHETTGKPHLQPRAAGLGLAAALLGEVMLAGRIRCWRGLIIPAGGGLAQAARWLFLTSLFAAALAFHNAVWRYAYALGRENVLPAALGRTGGNNIPKAASLAQSACGLAVIGVYAVAGWNPMTRLFFWLVIPSPRRAVVGV